MLTGLFSPQRGPSSSLDRIERTNRSFESSFAPQDCNTPCTLSQPRTRGFAAYLSGSEAAAPFRDTLHDTIRGGLHYRATRYAYDLRPPEDFLVEIFEVGGG